MRKTITAEQAVDMKELNHDGIHSFETLDRIMGKGYIRVESAEPQLNGDVWLQYTNGSGGRVKPDHELVIESW